ncbi:hypothetical protein PMZ80_003115 [Knufia obscura]|uniref:MARVEL domain-containing protein n=1 Tax=Knufia obscura TaxID=1635080 RepID=A0ABR0RUC0_9EURO|nr:hypothetical protein PMZ80_003115 [Knufia obscura]
MFLRQVKDFFSIINTDALVFLGMRLASIVLSITSIILLCRAVTVQQFFLTDGLGLVYDMLPLGPLAYTLVWSVVSLILPGCQRKYHPVLDVAFDFFGWVLSFAAGGALLSWALKDAYEMDFCTNLAQEECERAGNDLSGTEKSGAVLLLFTGITHFIMFVRACRSVHARRKKYVPSRNSFMQLEKGSDRRLEVSPLELNTPNFVEAEQDRQRQQDACGKKPSVDSSIDSPV